jgi:hypothetical protein
MGGEGFSTAVLRGVTAIDLSITVFRCYICAALQTDVAGIMYATCLVSDVAMTWPYTLCVEHGRSKITPNKKLGEATWISTNVLLYGGRM